MLCFIPSTLVGVLVLDSNHLPDKTSLFKLGRSFMSMMGVTTPSNMPNSVSIPIVISIRKNITAHNVDNGILFIASVKIMNASPCPLGTWQNIDVNFL